MKVLSKAEWKRRQRRKKYIVLGTAAVVLLAIVVLLIVGAVKLIQNIVFKEELGTWSSAGDVSIQAELLTPNDYSRSQIALNKVNAVVVHFMGNAGSSAMSNRNYFEQLKLLKKNAAGAHFIVGLDGEIIQCIPVNEVAYASGPRNEDSIAIEYCHPDDSGTPNAETYDSLVKLTAEVCIRFGLDEDDILRHYDITEADCPKYFVENEEAWTKFKADVMTVVNSSNSAGK